MASLRTSVITCLTTGLLGSVLALTDLGWRLEQDIGLQWLYQLRGTREPPGEIVVVGIDERSSRRLGLPRSLVQWPRAVHACLIDGLSKAGASIIVYDVFFGARPTAARSTVTESPDRNLHPKVEECLDEKSASGPALLQSVRAARRVVLLRRLIPPPEPANDDRPSIPQGVREGAEIGEASGLIRAAAGAAPWPLPVQPARVDEYWAFKLTAGPTLPMVSLQLYALRHLEQLHTLLQDEAEVGLERLSPRVLESPDAEQLAHEMRKLRMALWSRPTVARGVLEKLKSSGASADSPLATLSALVEAYAGPDARYLNFYGPPGTIRTVSFGDAFLDLHVEQGREALDLSGTAIFIGVSETRGPQTADGYYTVYRAGDGGDLSGVEIAATAFANLLTSTSLDPPTVLETIVILFLYGVLLGALVCQLPALQALGAVALASAAYTAVAVASFAYANSWLPLFPVLVVQLPCALILGFTLQYVSARRAVRWYVPENVVHRLVANSNRLDDAELVFGTCMSTDISGFTKVSERLEPDELAALLNRYFAVLGNSIDRHHGVMLDIVGDGTMSAWTDKQPRPQTRLRACVAAIEILQAVHRFNVQHADTALPTRIGLDSGGFAIGNVGSEKHMAYSAVGEIANTASRIQELNKHLVTRLLASEQTITGLDDLIARPVGRFRLVGKSDAVNVYQIHGSREECADEILALVALSEEAFRHYDAGRWDEAITVLTAINAQYPTDGPARFHLRRCQDARLSPQSTEASTVIEMKLK